MADLGRVTRTRKRAEEARDMRAKDNDRALSLLGRAFPNLSKADGLKPFWNPYALSDWARDSARTEEQTAKPTDSSGTTTVETRTRAGRDAFDTALLGLLAGVQNGLSARDIAEETGASLPQNRSAITRLGKKVRSKGNTAARRYWART